MKSWTIRRRSHRGSAKPESRQLSKREKRANQIQRKIRWCKMISWQAGDSKRSVRLVRKVKKHGSRVARRVGKQACFDALTLPADELE